MEHSIKISVITPTIRTDGLKVVRESLLKQTFRDFEWLVDVNVTGSHDLNASFNKMIKRSKGELIVFCEDYNKLPADALQKWWDAYQKYPRVLFTAPLGKVNNLAFEGKANWDWRAWTKGDKVTDFMPSSWNTCELDWAAIPKHILSEIGGFEEKLDQWWSCDNLAIGKLACLKGYTFMNYFGNPALVYDHDAFMAHPFRDKYNIKEVNDILDTYTPDTVLPYLNG